MQEQQDSELKAFSTHFDSIKFRKHTEIRLALARGGAVTTIVDGEKVRTALPPSRPGMHVECCSPPARVQRVQAATVAEHSSAAQQRGGN